MVDLEKELRDILERQLSWDQRMADTKVNWERWELDDEKKRDAERKNEIQQRTTQLKMILGKTLARSILIVVTIP